MLDSTRPSLACSLAFWLLSPVCIALLARKTSDGQEGKGDHRGEERDTGLERRTIRSRRRGRIVRARFFLFREGCERQEEKSTLLQPAPQKSLEKVSLSLSLSPSDLLPPSLARAITASFFFINRAENIQIIVLTRRKTEKREKHLPLSSISKKTPSSLLFTSGVFSSLSVCGGGGGERVLKVKSLFTSSPARPPCSRPTRPSRPSSWRSTPSASRAQP